MLKWLQGERRVGADEPLLTDDPLATIAGRGPRRRSPQPVYSVTRVNPLYRDGPATAPEPDDRQDSSEDARPTSPESSAAGDDLDTERVSVSSAGPARRPPPSPPPLSAPPPAPPPRRALRLRRGHGWAGIDVLKLDTEYVSGMSVNLARLMPKTAEERKLAASRQRTTRNTVVRRRPPARSTLTANPEFVRGVVVTTITAQPATCPRMVIQTNPQYVVTIGVRCRHTKSAAPLPSPANARSSALMSPATTTGSGCHRISVMLNPAFVKAVTPNCHHVQDPPSPRDWTTSPPAPSFQIGAPSQYASLFFSSPHHGLAALPSLPPDAVGPDSIVSDSLLMLTSPDLTPATTLHPRRLSPPMLPPADQLTPDHVLAQFSQVIANSRSVAMVRRAGSDARSSASASSGSSAGSVTSRSSGRPDPALAAAPVTFVTNLWERTGLRTNGRRLLVNEEVEGDEEEGGSTSSGSRSGRTPSPPVPPRLPISQSWLQRLAELPGLRPAPVVRVAEPLDPAALTAVIVEPAVASAPSGPDGATWGRHVKFAGGGASRLSPPSPGAPPSDQQRLWNTYYGTGAGSGYGALSPAPLHVQEVKRAAGLHVSSRPAARRRA